MRGEAEQTAPGCEREGQRVCNGLADNSAQGGNGEDDRVRIKGANCPAHREKK